MRDAINKQALIDHLNSGANELYEKGAIVPSGILVILRDEIEEGKFDTPSDQGEVRRLHDDIVEAINIWECMTMEDDTVEIIERVIRKLHEAVAASNQGEETKE